MTGCSQQSITGKGDPRSMEGKETLEQRTPLLQKDKVLSVRGRRPRRRLHITPVYPASFLLSEKDSQRNAFHIVDDSPKRR